MKAVLMNAWKWKIWRKPWENDLKDTAIVVEEHQVPILLNGLQIIMNIFEGWVFENCSHSERNGKTCTSWTKTDLLLEKSLICFYGNFVVLCLLKELTQCALFFKFVFKASFSALFQLSCLTIFATWRCRVALWSCAPMDCRKPVLLRSESQCSFFSMASRCAVRLGAICMALGRTGFQGSSMQWRQENWVRPLIADIWVGVRRRLPRQSGEKFIATFLRSTSVKLRLCQMMRIRMVAVASLALMKMLRHQF